MKRSKYLVPLSWEHHGALVNANRIKLGVEKKAASNEILQFVRYIWEHDLLPHFKREENIILNHGEANRIPKAIRERTIKEHKEFIDLMEQIGQVQKEEQYRELFQQFSRLLIAHVRFEENEFFPAVENEFLPETLREIGEKLKDRHVPACITWQPPFWKK